MIRACVPSGGYGEKFLATLAQAGRHDRPGNSFFTRREDSLEGLMQDGLASLLRAYRTLEKLTAITPRPAINSVRYHGVLAPLARSRSQVVRDGRPAPDATARSLT